MSIRETVPNLLYNLALVLERRVQEVLLLLRKRKNVRRVWRGVK